MLSELWGLKVVAVANSSEESQTIKAHSTSGFDSLPSTPSLLWPPFYPDTFAVILKL